MVDRRSPVMLALVAALAAAGGCRGSCAGEPAAGPSSSAAESGDEGAPGEPPPAQSSALRCEKQPFAAELAIGEASGATYVVEGESSYIAVVGDSGNRGRIVWLDPSDGRLLWRGRLPMDGGASDDLEGLSSRDGVLYGLTSSGWMRHWRRIAEPGTAGAAYELTVPAYPLAGPGRLRCASPHHTNCARDYEGLCLRSGPVAAGQCVGFAASKRDGALYCLIIEDDGRLAIDPARVISVVPPAVLSGCHFATDHFATGPGQGEAGGEALWLGSNLFGLSRVHRVTGWQRDAVVIGNVGTLGSGFPEAIAVYQDAIYRFSDTAAATSLADKYLCQ
ncbi:MAG: hypothetical protein AAGC55_03285 [Myxococcota bacterium]